MLITTSCALIGHIRNNVNDLKDYNEKQCCSNVSSCFSGGVLRDETKSGCEGDQPLSQLATFDEVQASCYELPSSRHMQRPKKLLCYAKHYIIYYYTLVSPARF